jgi:hypothetical protein
LTERSRDVDRREAQADVIIEAAEAIAAGKIDIEVSMPPDRDGTSPSAAKPRFSFTGIVAAALRKRSPSGLARAAEAFGAAWVRLREKAKIAADASIERDRAEIARADEMIVEAAQSLPSAQRARVAKARRLVPTLLERLGRGNASAPEAATRRPSSGQCGGSEGRGS